MLNRFAQNPKALFTQYLEEGPDNMDPRIAYSCNECSQCTLKCPKGLNLKSVFQSLKADYAAENGGIVPLKTLLPSELGQVKECSPEYCTAVAGSTKTSAAEKLHTKYVFIPGSLTPACSPDAVENALRHLKDCLGEENVGSIPQDRCEDPAFVSGSERFPVCSDRALDTLDEMGAEVIITVCPSCYKFFKESSKHQTVISYWNLMRTLIGLPPCAKGAGVHSSQTFHIHDSCVSCDESGQDESIRWILDQMGYSWDVFPHNRYEPCRSTLEAADLDSLQILEMMFPTSTCTAGLSVN